MRSLFKIFSQRQASSREEVGSFPLQEDRFSELVSFAEDREIRPRLSGLIPASGGVGLEIAPRLSPLASILKEKGLARVVGQGTFRDRQSFAQTPADFLVSPADQLPFVDGSFDFVLCRMGLVKGRAARVLREVGRVLRPNASALVSDLHPFSPMVRGTSRNRSGGEDLGFEWWFREATEGGLRIDSVREVFFEGALKKFFGGKGEERVFEGLRRHPFLILLTVVRKES